MAGDSTMKGRCRGAGPGPDEADGRFAAAAYLGHNGSIARLRRYGLSADGRFAAAAYRGPGDPCEWSSGDSLEGGRTPGPAVTFRKALTARVSRGMLSVAVGDPDPGS